MMGKTHFYRQISREDYQKFQGGGESTRLEAFLYKNSISQNNFSHVNMCSREVSGKGYAKQAEGLLEGDAFDDRSNN